MSAKFIGKWKLVSSEKFDDYMKAVGVSMLTRKAAGAVKPDVIISETGGVWKLRSESSIKKSEINFKLGEEFEEETQDGRKVKTTMTMVGDNTLVHSQKGDTDSVLTRVVDGDTLTLTCEAKGVVCTRVYKKA